MEYALVARPLRAKLNDLIGGLPGLLVHEFLDVASAMPPERLRWSRILKRPLMAHAEPDDNILGAVNIDEVLPYGDARVGGNCATSRRIVFVHRSVASLPEHLRNPDWFWGVYIYSDGDRQFNAKWEAAHGYQWPFIADKRVHPGLEALYRKYMQFEREWSAHAGVCSSEFHEYLYQQELENIRIFLDGQDQLQALT